jgi:SAM-dependent methyltransferase
MTDQNGQTSDALFQLSMSDFEQIVNFLKSDPSQLLHVPMIRAQLAMARIKALKPDDIKTLDDENTAAIKNTVLHNLNGLSKGAALERPLRLIEPLHSIFHVMVNAREMKVLSVGPRAESEIFMLLSKGFAQENITGLDLISYSPIIKLGDMHDIPFDDDSYDVIILGWVLAYSNDVPQAVREVLRVAKSGAYVAVGWEYNPTSQEDLEATGTIVDGGRCTNANQILEFFEDQVDEVIFRANPHPDMLDQVCDVIVIFRLK